MLDMGKKYREWGLALLDLTDQGKAKTVSETEPQPLPDLSSASFDGYQEGCLNLAIRSSWSEPQLAPGLSFAYYIKLLHFFLQRI